MARQFSSVLMAGVVALALLPVAAFSQPSNSAAGKDDSAAAAQNSASQGPEVFAPSKTEGTVEIEGKTIAYTAIAGTLTVGATHEQDAMIGADGKPLPGQATLPKDPAQDPPTAQMFYVAYFKQGADPNTRPITFLYNGGPGSSTMWLHMGAFGPKRVSTPLDTHMPPAPYHLENNQYSLLDASDLVFIDMPGTGFGRLYGKDKDKAFWGVDQDANAFARFIARFLGTYNRWNSPKYLFGESYGTTRSAVLANILQSSKGIDLNGVMLLSQVLNFGDLPDGPKANPGNDLPYELALPTYAATAAYHHKLPEQPADLQAFLKEVEAFATGDYAHALWEGNQISDSEKKTVAEKLHTYTGLPAAYWMKADLRVSGGNFEKTLQDDQDLTTGRLDARFSGPTLDPLSEEAEYDPQSAALTSAYLSLFNQYARQVLKYGDGQTYLNRALFGSYNWDSKHAQPGGTASDGSNALNVMPDLATAMKMNPQLKVMLNAGYYDLATPFFAATYEEHHLPINPSLTKNIEYDYYESGHMVYARDESLHRLHDNAAAFIHSAENVSK
ncbi:MAG TPA: peptidase S10 [Acidobacteriaceae bacterium]